MPFSFKMLFLFGSRNSCAECINPKCWLCIWCFLCFLLVQIPATINLNLTNPSLAGSWIKMMMKSICSGNKPTGNVPRCIPLPSCLWCLKALYALNSRIIRYFFEWSGFIWIMGMLSQLSNSQLLYSNLPFRFPFKGDLVQWLGKCNMYWLA